MHGSDPGGGAVGGVRIGLVESNASLRGDLVRALVRLGFEVHGYADGLDARADAMRLRPTLRVLDLHAPGVESWLADGDFNGPTLLTTHQAPSAAERRRLLAGESEILCKPFPIGELEARILASLALVSSGAIGSEGTRGGDPILATREPALAVTLERARRLARREVPVCLVGELGSGRRALARRLHGWSARRSHPLVELDRSALEADGATRIDAVLARTLERVGRGTLVLIEPADQLPRAQESLAHRLRALGDDGPRWLTVTREPLERSVREGRLLLELQYRLEVAALGLPALRERPLDHGALCRAIAGEIARELGQTPPTLEDDLVEWLALEGFPGNRLGLESRIRGLLMQRGATPGGLRPPASVHRVGRAVGAADTPFFNLKRLERDAIERALAHWRGNRTRASEALGISVRTLRNKIREYGLR